MSRYTEVFQRSLADPAAFRGETGAPASTSASSMRWGTRCACTCRGRTDDVINVAGHRLSAGEMQEVLASQPDVAECAVFGVHDALKGQLPGA